MVYCVWHYVLVISGRKKDEYYFVRRVSEVIPIIYAVSLSIVGFYFIVCLRSLKLKFLNEKLPISLAFHSRVEANDVTSPLVVQPTMV